uniref:Uncharacterized protein n=2 Tax=Homalodisca liturata TaxID=320908 RepID=A0A1B6K3A4_9HEMI
MTSVPVLALMTVHFCQNWGYWMLLTQLPNYLSHVLRFDLKSNGLISSLPYLIMCLLTFVFSWAADYINARRILPLSASRKIWNSLALYDSMEVYYDVSTSFGTHHRALLSELGLLDASNTATKLPKSRSSF